MRLSDNEIIEALLLLATEALGSFLPASLSDVLDVLADRHILRVVLSELPSIAVLDRAMPKGAAHAEKLQLA